MGQERPRGSWGHTPPGPQGVQQGQTSGRHERRTPRRHDLWHTHQGREALHQDWRQLERDRYHLWRDRRSGHGAVGEADQTHSRHAWSHLRRDREERRHNWSGWRREHHGAYHDWWRQPQQRDWRW